MNSVNIFASDKALIGEVQASPLPKIGKDKPTSAAEPAEILVQKILIRPSSPWR